MRLLRKKKIVKKDITQIAKGNLSKSMDKISKALEEDNLDEAYAQFFHSVREFFMKLFKLKYEFTLNELNKEIAKKDINEDLKTKINDFLKDVSFLEYGSKRKDKRTLTRKIKNFQEITKKLVKKPRTKKKEDTGVAKFVKVDKFKDNLVGVLRSLNLYKTEEEKKEKKRKRKEEVARKEKEVTKLEKIHEKIVKIKKLQSNIVKLIQENRIDDAKKAYLDLEKIYRGLDARSKKETYDAVRKAYKDIIATTKVDQPELSGLDVLMKSVEQTKKSLNKFNLDELKKNYASILKKYGDLSGKDQKLVYGEIEQLRVSLKEREDKLLIKDIASNLEAAYEKLNKKEIKSAKEYYFKSHKLYEKLSEPRKAKIYKMLKKFYETTSKMKS